MIPKTESGPIEGCWCAPCAKVGTFMWRYVLMYAFWGIWTERNRRTFRGKRPQLNTLVTSIEGQVAYVAWQHSFNKSIPWEVLFLNGM
jgi:hypothetical protein